MWPDLRQSGPSLKLQEDKHTIIHSFRPPVTRTSPHDWPQLTPSLQCVMTLASGSKG